MNFTNLTARETFDGTKTRIGFTGGINYEIKVSNQYRLGIDALYSQKGFIDKMVFLDDYGNETGESENFEFYYDYLEIPLKFGIEMGNRK